MDILDQYKNKNFKTNNDVNIKNNVNINSDLFYLNFLLHLPKVVDRKEKLEKYLNEITENFVVNFNELYKSIKNNSKSKINYNEEIDKLLKIKTLSENFLRFSALLYYFKSDNFEISLKNLNKTLKINEGFFREYGKANINEVLIKKEFEKISNKLSNYISNYSNLSTRGLQKSLKITSEKKEIINNIFENYLEENKNAIKQIFNNMMTIIEKNEVLNKLKEQGTEIKNNLKIKQQIREITELKNKIQQPELRKLAPTPKMGI